MDMMQSSTNPRKHLVLLATLCSSVLLVFFFVSGDYSSFFTSSKPSPYRRIALQSSSGYPHCDGTLYPELCVSTLATARIPKDAPLPDVIRATLSRAVDAVQSSAGTCSAYLRRPVNLSFRDSLALGDCLDLFQLSINFLSASSASSAANLSVSDVQTLLSAALTNQYTCLDGFIAPPSAAGGGDRIRPFVNSRINHAAHLISNSLAMVTKLPRRRVSPRQVPPFAGYGDVVRGFPRWISGKDRRLLQAPLPDDSSLPQPPLPPPPPPPTSSQLQYDLVVAKDGSGNFTTVAEAVAAAPNNSDTRFVIYIKAGGYFENVEVGPMKTNLMFVGDGMWKTIIKSSRNVVDGWTTFRSATVAVVGNGFLARDLTIENTAGPSKHQAVALRVGADFAAFYRCSFVGYQDTLYVHSLRQFYRECDIYGTVDFIFGDAAVLFQSCNLYARRPDPNQKNVFTAQGREDPNQNTGIAIQRCKVAAAADLIPVQSNFSTYLGRPWKQYSRTVVMESNLEGLIHPAGWLAWNGTFALDTLYYAEYMNVGPGANTTGRVTWPGYHVMNSSLDAANFTASSFVQGDQWLSSTSIPFMLGL